MKKYFVLFSVIVTSFTFCSVKKKSNDIVWKNVIGTIEPMGRETYIHYYVDGNLHTERYYLIIYGAVKGEKFPVVPDVPLQRASGEELINNYFINEVFLFEIC